MEGKTFSIPNYHKILTVENNDVRNEIEDLENLKSYSRKLLLCVFVIFVFFLVGLCLYSVDIAEGKQDRFISILGVAFFTVGLISLLVALLAISVKHVQTLSYSLIRSFLLIQLMTTTALAILFAGQLVVTIQTFAQDCITETCYDAQSTVISMTVVDGVCVLLSLLGVLFSLGFRDSLWRVIEGQAQRIMKNFRQTPSYGTGTAQP
eukprot:TRINITY_DN1949_c0_g1_i1.p1 TRINITY_DN1949_c0_g1~~TRINITY_DN1949_c0_g1_i1.p1  ORF type:complete len:207 (-),score=21.67 TRINITY_DN1949_c0_g1_i1:82-702(-)